MRCSLGLPIALILTASGLAGCTGKGDTSGDTGGGGGGTDTTTTTDTEDTAAETPVWEEDRVETSSTLTGLYPTTDGLVVVSQGGHCWIRASGTWTGVTLDTNEEDLNDLWGSGEEASLQMVAVGNVGIVATWVDDAWSLDDIGTANLLAISGPAEADLIAVGWGGIFDNTSGEFTYEDVATSRRFNDVWWDGTDGMAVGEDGDYAVYNGTTWVDDALSTRETLHSVYGTAADDIWAAGDDGTVLHWDGSTWNDVLSPATTTLWGIWEASETEVYVVGDNGAAYMYDGSTWTSLPTGVDNNLYNVGSMGAGTIWAIGNRGMVLQYKVGAATARKAR